MSYFDSSKNQQTIIKILFAVLVIQFIFNAVLFKSVIDVASDKTFKFEVPAFLETGEYSIGTSFANDRVYKMWTKLWVQEISSFSYEDINEKMDSIMDFLDPATAYKNKSELLKFVDFAKENFVTQKFDIEDFSISDTSKPGYKEIKWTGKLSRKIGLKDDPLTGLKYSYVFTCFTRNGQIYIHSMTLQRENMDERKTREALKANQFINYEVYQKSDEKSKKKEKQK